MRFLILLLLLPILTYSQIKTITDINPDGGGVSGNAIAKLNDRLIFNGRQALNNNEPWACDLDGSNLVQLADLNANGSSSPYEFTTVGNRVYFSAFGDQIGRELYYTDGTTVSLVRDIRPGLSANDPKNFIASGDTIYFSANTNDGDQLFMANTDTVMQITFFDFIGTSPSDFVVFQGGIYFGGIQNDTLGYELYKWQGGFTAPQLVKDIYPGSQEGGPEQMQVINNRLYFRATNDLGNELWTSDGTMDGTYLLTDLNPGSEDGNPHSFTTMGDNRFVFVATDPSLGAELWISDGTEEGTLFLKDIREGAFASNPSDLINVNGRVFFNAFTEGIGSELWITDGTEAGTQLVKDINPGSASANFQSSDMLSYDNTLYFTAEDGVHGLELWKSDGTEAGTQMVQDYAVGPTDARPSTLTEYNGTLYFKIISDTVGMELGTYTPTDPCLGINCPIGEVCLNGTCLEPCETIECPDSLYCDGVGCVAPPEPCDGVQCPIGEVCLDGTCLEPCETIECPDSLYCDGVECVVPPEPCDGVECPIGEICYEGSCYTTCQDCGDSIDCYGGMCYEKDPCEGVLCPIGEICYNGICAAPGAEVVKIIRLLSAADSTPVAGIEVNELGVLNRTYISDIYGDVRITYLNGSREIRILDPSGTYLSTVLPLYNSQNIIFLEPATGCEGISCPIGQVCFEGVCYSDVTETFSGYVQNTEGYALPGVSIIGNYGQPVETDSNGFFQYASNITATIVPVEVHKTNYRSQQLLLGPVDTNRITLTASSPCDGTVCPIGQRCYEGSCYETCDSTCLTRLTDACANITCPIGMVCYEGSCYTPCYDTTSFCLDQLADPCEDILPPPGFTCFQGTIVPECSENPISCSSENICEFISCGPDAEACFQCSDTTGYNTSGNSEVIGTVSLNESDANLRRASSEEDGIFLMLINAKTNRKVAITKTTANGSFQFDSLPEGDYKLFVVIRNYFMPDSEQMITLDANQKIQMTITTKQDLLQVDQKIIIGIEEFTSKAEANYWYPVPNQGNGFFLKNMSQNSISNFKITDLFGKPIETNTELKISGDQVTFIPKIPLPSGIYLFSWTEGKNSVWRTQKISVLY